MICSRCHQDKPSHRFYSYHKRCKDCFAEISRLRRLANPDEVKRIRLKKQFGVSFEWFTDKLQKQGNVCAICGNPETAKDPRHAKVRSLAVDHSHRSGKVRGLLCSRCNLGLGSFLDDQTALDRAISYLREYEETQFVLSDETKRFIACVLNPYYDPETMKGSVT